jgi:hypothetical protein
MGLELEVVIDFQDDEVDPHLGQLRQIARQPLKIGVIVVVEQVNPTPFLRRLSLFDALPLRRSGQFQRENNQRANQNPRKPQ